jgi:UDP-N-acetylmuramyl pentapeptide phosphotransferase/UDP-N-acetylglucosamine-1-phosphate transferase
VNTSWPAEETKVDNGKDEETKPMNTLQDRHSLYPVVFVVVVVVVVVVVAAATVVDDYVMIKEEEERKMTTIISLCLYTVKLP